MKRKIIILATLVCLLMAPVVPMTQPAGASNPRVYIVGDNGFFGFDSNGNVHYVLTSDGLRYYDIPSYGYCGYHHRSHKCRYVAPKYHKHHKHHKKEYKKARKHYKKHHGKYYDKKYRKHHHDHDDD